MNKDISFSSAYIARRGPQFAGFSVNLQILSATLFEQRRLYRLRAITERSFNLFPVHNNSLCFFLTFMTKLDLIR